MPRRVPLSSKIDQIIPQEILAQNSSKGFHAEFAVLGTYQEIFFCEKWTKFRESTSTLINTYQVLMCMSCVGPFSIKGQSFWQQIIQHWSLLESTTTTSTYQAV